MSDSRRTPGKAPRQPHAVQARGSAAAGYHFNLNFVLKWPSVSAAAVRRARLIGLDVGDDGAELEPLSTSISFTGTRWTGYASGGLRFDVTSYRKDLRATVFLDPGAVGTHANYAFGLARPDRLNHGGSNESDLNQVVGLWLQNGSLALLASDGLVGHTVAAQTIVHFDAWDALADLWRLSLKQPRIPNVAASKRPPSTMDPAPTWAPQCKVRLLTAPGELRATISHPCLFVGAGVSSIIAVKD